MSEGPSTRPPRDGGAAQHPTSATLGESILKWLRGLSRDNGGDELRNTLQEVIDAYENGGRAMGPEQWEMLQNTLSFGELQVDDVMVPRADIVALEAGSSLDEVVQTFRRERHSRLPVYRETLDDMIGFVHLKDIVEFWGDGKAFDLPAVAHDLLVVPPSMLVLELLARMRATRIHMAIVVDEYGGTDGLVTIEDVVEEIVGDIPDEHEEGEPLLVAHADGSYDADGRTEIEQFEEILEVDLLPDEDDEEVDTLGGFVFHLLGRVPRRGEKVRHPRARLEFEVVDADPRRVKMLKVRRLTAADAGES